MRVNQQINEDNLDIVSAGVAFFGFLAIFPAIAAVISIYGLAVSPQAVQQQFMKLSGILPGETHQLVAQSLAQIAGKTQALGWGLAISLILAIWSANSGTSALFKGLNIAYDEKIKRGFIKGTALTLLFSLLIILVIIISMIVIVAVPVFLNNLDPPHTFSILLNVLRWIVMASIVLLLLAVLYRYAPDRERPKWQWVTWGSVTAAALWLFASWAFSFYVSHFGNYNATYGSLAAVVILLFWFYLSTYIVLLGAEINAEMEHQTAKDTTTGPEQPMGTSGGISGRRPGRGEINLGRWYFFPVFQVECLMPELKVLIL